MPLEVLPSPEIWNRDDFPLLCVWRKLRRAVEVGVDRGVWARLFLDRWYDGEEWWGVDAWRPYPEMPFDREADRELAVANIAPHSHRAKLIRATSAEAAAIFAPGSVDFAYIDGAHDHDSALADLRAWWPTLSAHGILAGHDWTDQPVHAGVQSAVRAFAAEAGIEAVYLTAVEPYAIEACPSWYCYRADGGRIPGSGWRRC